MSREELEAEGPVEELSQEPRGALRVRTRTVPQGMESRRAGKEGLWGGLGTAALWSGRERRR